MTKPMRLATGAETLVGEFARMGVAGWLAGADIWRRSSALGARYLELAAARGFRAALDSEEPELLARMLVGGYRSFLSEMVCILPLAAERFAVAAGGPARASLPGDEEAPPVRTYSIQNKPVMLPARIHDAAQGLAVFTVSASQAQAWLDERTADDQSDSKQSRFNVLRLKANQTPLAIFIVDYRVSDLGEYHELGVALFVTPATDPAAMPGMFIIELPVNAEFTREAGETIWGYPKSFADLRFTYEPERVRCQFRRSTEGAKRGGKHVMNVTYPRSGEGSSTDIPFYSYTLKYSDSLKKDVPTFTIFTRSGCGEGAVAGGKGFELTLGSADPLAQQLRSLGLPKAPIMHGWTEHMSGAFGIPHAMT